MSRWLFCALLFTGCVPVTTPLSDPTKSEPDKELIGKWKLIKSTGTGMSPMFTIDAPVVKGNPKGLMRHSENDRSLWFVITKIGKHNYATIFIGANRAKEDTDNQFTNLSEEGDFEKYMKREDQSYWIMNYVIEGDKLIIDVGNLATTIEIMRRENFNKKNDYYNTPKDWLANNLKKDPKKFFDGENTVTYEKLKN
jgi:hypothetical protein